MLTTDHKFLGIPWKAGGRDFTGADCVGVTVLWLRENHNFQAPAPQSNQQGRATELLQGRNFDAATLERGDAVFFAKDGKVVHVSVWLGHGKLLNILRGYDSRVENGFTLMRRLGLSPVAAIKPEEAEVLSLALADASVGDPGTWVAIGVSAALSVVSAVMSILLAPKLPRAGNKYGRYSFDALLTRTSTEMPLPDLLGGVVTAGNSPYTQLSDKNLSATPSNQMANKIIIFASGPCEGLDLELVNLKINGLTYTDRYFKDTVNNTGFTLNPLQTKAEAVSGTINGDTLVPSLTIHNGAHAAEVPVDIRAHYDRTFPVYGYSGCCYGVFRLADSSKFSQLNVTARIKGRKCREFNSSGFTTQNSNELLDGDGATPRFKLGTDDIVVMNSLEVDGTPYTEMSATNQTGNVYHLNRTKGCIEFLTPPTNGAVIAADYDAYVRSHTQNPARHLVYLLTEIGRGNGYDASKINFSSFSDAADYFDETVDWVNSNGVTSGPRYTTNYAVDFRKPIQEHLRALLDACRSVIFVSDGKFVLKPIISADSVFSFNPTNILKESFSSTLVDRAETPNRIKAFYHSSDTYQAETEAVREDVMDQEARSARAANGGVVEENLKYPAVDNQSQAERLAEIYLRSQVNSRWRCSFTTTVQALALEVGDVVDVTHPSQPTWDAKMFRIQDLQFDEDGRLELQLSEYFTGEEI